ncbi:MAG: hypothetical protein OZ929_23940, partial [Bryobacterales bacterium]|nr:hypothetical protein [Bryobacterales bacterium]
CFNRLQAIHKAGKGRLYAYPWGGIPAIPGLRIGERGRGITNIARAVVGAHRRPLDGACRLVLLGTAIFPTARDRS